MAPERFLIESFRANLAAFRAQFGEVCQVVIDECHCVSEWGHDFRPAYLSLSRIVRERTKRLSVSAPLVALTGTASTIVLADVRRELGIDDAGAVIRARRLDRDEIALVCRKLPQRQKHRDISSLVGQFLVDHPDPLEGLLLFCRFAGGVDGVIGVTADILPVTGADQTRFFCGADPKWKQYAAIWTKKKSSSFAGNEWMKFVPVWALAPNGNLRDWEEVKAESQRQFLSGLPGSFRVMVATNAFGMGIDKPSVRHVIHFMVPQSPEAYYQEVGRAGRDRKPSVATLLFSDEDHGITDQLLSPENSIEDVRRIYKDFAKDNRFQGGDFIRTFYFHQNSFAGPDEEANCICSLLREIRKALAEGKSLRFKYIPNLQVYDDDGALPKSWNDEKNLEYAIVRLILLGAIRDYVKDYNKKAFEVELHVEWEESLHDLPTHARRYAEYYQSYVRRYQVRATQRGVQEILTAATLDAVERAASQAIVAYVGSSRNRVGDFEGF